MFGGIGKVINAKILGGKLPSSVVTGIASAMKDLTPQIQGLFGAVSVEQVDKDIADEIQHLVLRNTAVVEAIHAGGQAGQPGQAFLQEILQSYNAECQASVSKLQQLLQQRSAALVGTAQALQLQQIQNNMQQMQQIQSINNALNKNAAEIIKNIR